MIRGHDILCISSQDWDVHFGTTQQTMYQLAEHNRVFYVNLTYILPTIFTHHQARARLAAKRRERPEVPGHLIEYSPPPIFLPTGTLPPTLRTPIQRLNDAMFTSILKGQMNAVGMSNPILWVFSVRWPGLFQSIPSKLRVYDCVDEWGAWSGDTGGKQSYNAELDRRLCQDSDLVFVVSKPLLESKRQLTDEVHLIPNGVDFDLFNRSAQPDAPRAQDFPEGDAPVIGFTGYLDDRLDVDALKTIAKTRPDWRIVLVGPCISERVETALSASGHANLTWLGPRKQEELPTYVKGFDVCLVPYRLDEFTKNIYPLKLYEYMASGKPIVSSPIPAVLDEHPLVEIAETPDEYIQHIDNLLSKNDPEGSAARIERARSNTWAQRAEAKSEILERYLRQG